MRVSVTLHDPEFLAGVVLARGVKVGPSPESLIRLLDEATAQPTPDEPMKDPVRAMLRRGGFKPSGRNKPASEYLAQAAREGRFPRINNLVDVINLLSLESGLPISLLDLAAIGDQTDIATAASAKRTSSTPAARRSTSKASSASATPKANPSALRSRTPWPAKSKTRRPR